MTEIVECPNDGCTKQNIIEVPDNHSVGKVDSFEELEDRPYSSDDYIKKDDLETVDCDDCGMGIFIMFSLEI